MSSETNSIAHLPTDRVEPPTITVPPTPEGLATGLSYLGAAHDTMSPARSHPSNRSHPPLLELGDEVRIPPAVREAAPTTGIDITVPSDLSSLFVVAPLAYYLGAQVTVSDEDAGTLSVDGRPLRTFDSMPAYQHEVADLLQRTFYLDCQVRREPDEPQSALEYPAQHIRADGAAPAVPVDPATARSLEPGARLQHYLRSWEDRFDEHLPDWHLSTCAQAVPNRIPSLPALLNRLSLVYEPAASPLVGTDLLDQTLGDAYFTRGAPTSGAVLAPTVAAGRSHAWLAPGRPVDAFKPTGRAFENRERYRSQRGGPLDVAVVLNEERMADEHAAVGSIYRERAAAYPISVDVFEDLERDRLADTFESGYDFVHYIGHCDDGGLRCADGHLSPTALETCGTPTFFLNACGSYEDGLDLVERGAVAGAVTHTDVLDRHAARVGTAFARLLVHGFSIQRAIELARRRILMGKDYAVVGDGTHALLPSPCRPVLLKLESIDPDTFRVTAEVLGLRRTGERHAIPFVDEPVLNGETVETTLSRDALVETLTDESLPVTYDGDLVWSADLAASLAD